MKRKDKIQTIYLKYIFSENLNKNLSENADKNSNNYNNSNYNNYNLENLTIENISKDMALKYYFKSQDLILDNSNTNNLNANNLINLIIERGENGKPYFKDINDLFFNGTHSKDLMAVAMSDNLVGIDGEFLKKRNFLDIAKEYFSFNEYKFLKSSLKLEIDFYTIWTLKESYIKTFGKKIFDIKDSIEIDLNERAIYNTDNLFFATFIIDNCYIISVCCDLKNAENCKDIVIKINGYNLDLIFAYPDFPQIEIV